MTVMREMSFDDERRQAERMPRLLIVAPDSTTARRIGDELTGTTDSLAVTAVASDSANRGLDEYDVVVVYDDRSNDAFRKARERAGNEPYKVFDLAALEASDWTSSLRERIAGAVPDLAPALGRWFPVFRPAAAKAVIEESARVNAQFAVMSNLPAAIPIIGSFAAAGADMFVLTKNQVMMVFKLAAINGRDLSDQWRIMREMIPVVGAGFLWRTLAREAADFLPLMLGAVPKVVIAYTGTFAAGHAADLYVRYGKKPTKEQVQSFYTQATESFKKLPLPAIGSRGVPTEEPIDVDDNRAG
jgi:uncharacterized protein (DUF697 family)